MWTFSKWLTLWIWLQTDPAWPAPCYGHSGPPLEPGQAAAVVQLLRDAFARASL
jgi:hypothetical protein